LARGGGSLKLETLARAHPAWRQVEALEAKIRRLATTPPATATPSLPTGRAVRGSGLAGAGESPAGVSPEERREIERLTRARVEGDYQSLLTQLEREVERYEAVQRANAMARAEASLEARRERFANEYAAIAGRYADPLGERRLRLLALEPSVVDTAFYSAEERARRERDRVRIEGEIADLRARRQDELDMLRTAYEADIATLRSEAMTVAREATRTYEAQRRAQLRESRDRQQARAQQDLERALAGDPATSLPVRGGALADPRAEAAAAAIRVRVDRASTGIRQAQVGVSGTQSAVRRQLEAERDRLRAMIRESTRALVLAIAEEERLAIEFTDGSPDPELTRRMISLLEQRWQTVATPTVSAPS
jgi:hypothetical protein